MKLQTLTRERLDELVREVGARDGDKPPGVRRFERETSVTKHQWQAPLFRDWRSVLEAAGLKADALACMVEEHLRTPLERDVTWLGRKFAQTRVLTRADVQDEP